MPVNQGVRLAKKRKKDEFYTQLSDIEKELKYYKAHFKGKIVYCNCDDPKISNFFHYFSYNFDKLGLRKLISTCYKNRQMNLFSQNDSESAICLEYEGTRHEYGIPTKDQIRVYTLKEDGDFRSEECIQLLKQSDIVVTNPPFSLFREYVTQLIEHKKKFLVIGNLNAISYKTIFPLFQENLVWLGASIKSGDREFGVPDNYPLTAANSRIDENGNKFVRVKGVRWFTNLDYKQRHEDLILYKRYSPDEYKHYYNFDAINVNKTKEIPKDWDGIMGVPITFLDKCNPDQFQIIGLGIANLGKSIGVKPYTPEHRIYRKEVQRRAAVDGDLYMVENGKVKVTYARILIKNKRI